MHSQGPGRPSTVFAYAAMIFLLLPLLAVVPVSFTSKRYLSMPEGNWSLRHYQELIEGPEWLGSIWTSFSIGLAAAALSTFLAILFSVGIWYRQSALTRPLVALVLLPMAVPPIISALVLYFFETRTSLYDTLGGVVVAHTVMAVPYAVVTLMVALSQVDRRLELASRNMGASLWQTTVWIVLPNIKFGILSAAFLSFILSWEEISVTLFVTSTEIITLPRRIWSGLRENIDPVIAAISVLLIVVTMAAVAVKLAVEGRSPLRRA
ncbi:ABC transporter permease [Labrys monachus]|uniref:Spermidine/putrescine transport system permease protein n=1 Tax=Labrys monachus TaxID=217067 RepID=A0ABU0F6K5_9HYPH|nr:ABC transporter permease [Labrys monachus]MDQ0390250.1 putative spermidine/putrescine transport system permease protein [Labrys monachus]